MEVNSKSSATQAAIAAQARARAEAEKQTRQVERDAQERIQNAQDRADQVEREMDVRMEHARETTETALTVAEGRREKLLGTLKNQTYKDLADLKRRNSAELTRIQTEGERTAENTQAYFEDQVELAQYEGQKQLRENLTRNARMQAYQEQAASNEREILKRAHEEEIAARQKQYSEQRDQIQQQGESEIRQIQEKTAAGRKGAEQHFETTYSSTLKQNAEALHRANAEAKRQLDHLRLGHAQKLGIYEERLEDPFYRMVDLGVEIRDHGEHYTIRAELPEHERDHFKVNVRGKELILSGSRRNEEKVDLGEGKTRQVASFQTFQESVPLEWPVDPQGMVREFDGSSVVITLPKQGERRAPASQAHASPFTRAQAPRPDFPAGIPGPAPQRPDRPLGSS